mmetsp:Transcript_12205/g.24902  ORF Transcript_12205/g.24902 Transcript_12205/m.24902 type:complete len:94 (+) Transcript_12205:2910-3191(+)
MAVPAFIYSLTENPRHNANEACLTENQETSSTNLGCTGLCLGPEPSPIQLKNASNWEEEDIPRSSSGITVSTLGKCHPEEHINMGKHMNAFES